MIQGSLKIKGSLIKIDKVINFQKRIHTIAFLNTSFNVALMENFSLCTFGCCNIINFMQFSQTKCAAHSSRTYLSQTKIYFWYHTLGQAVTSNFQKMSQLNNSPKMVQQKHCPKLNGKLSF